MRIPVSVQEPVYTTGTEPYRNRNYRFSTTSTDFFIVLNCYNYQQIELYGITADVLCNGPSSKIRTANYVHTRNGLPFFKARSPPVHKGNHFFFHVGPDMPNWDEPGFGTSDFDIYSRKCPSMLLPGDAITFTLDIDAGDTWSIDSWWSESI